MRRTAQIAIVLVATAAAAVSGAVALLRAEHSSGGGTARTEFGRQHPSLKTDTATFAAGCFWKLEHAMRKVEGVVSTTAGYTGGDTTDPTHAAISTGRTGHSEAVRVEFDPAVVSYTRLLEVFWKSHDPMQFTREAGEPAPPGRSVIFYHTEEHRAAAEASKADVQSTTKYSAAEFPTEIVPAQPFFPAEAEHQQYLDKRGAGASCRVR